MLSWALKFLLCFMICFVLEFLAIIYHTSKIMDIQSVFLYLDENKLMYFSAVSYSAFIYSLILFSIYGLFFYYQEK